MEELLGQVLAELRWGESGGCQLISAPELLVTGPAEELSRIKSGWDSVRYELAGRLGLLLPEPHYQLSRGFATLCHHGEAIYTIMLFEPWIPRAIARLASDMARFLSFSCTSGLLEDLFRRAPCYREEMEKNGLPKLVVHQVLRELLAEQVSISNLELILYTILENCSLTRTAEFQLEFVRVALSESICRSLARPDKELRVLTISARLESLIERHIEKTESGSFLVLEPDLGLVFLKSLNRQVEAHRGESKLVLLCSPTVRSMLRRLTSRSFPHLPVMSWNEVAPYYSVFSLGVVD